MGISGIEDIRDMVELDDYCACHTDPEKYLESANQVPGSFVHQDDETWRSIVHQIRMTKTPDEREKIRKSIKITYAVYEDVLAQVKP
jgi:Xaa-Pro aminopeptidase